MAEADEIKHTINMQLDVLFEASDKMAAASDKLDDVMTELVAIVVDSGSTDLVQAISLIEAIRLALSLDLSNIHGVGGKLVSYRDRL